MIYCNHLAKSIITKSPEETQALGEEIGKTLRKGDVVALTGELGAGKTCLSQGLGWGLGVDRSIYLRSPSFTLIKEYHGKLPIYHFDFFRLNNVEEACELGCEDYFYGNGVAIVEWAEKIESILPAGYLKIEMEIVSENERKIRIHTRN